MTRPRLLSTALCAVTLVAPVAAHMPGTAAAPHIGCGSGIWGIGPRDGR
jgi:hypothetical protein